MKSDLREIYERGLRQLEAHFIKTASVVAGTTSSMGAELAGVPFELAIIDEGS